MTENLIHVSEARQLLLRAVETQGRDFVYAAKPGSGCFNVPLTDEISKFYGKEPAHADDPRRQTGCLVGTALRLSGRPINWDSMSYAGGATYEFMPYLTRDAHDYLSIAQQAQDGGSTWGAAYDQAEAFAEKCAWI